VDNLVNVVDDLLNVWIYKKKTLDKLIDHIDRSHKKQYSITEMISIMSDLAGDGKKYAIQQSNTSRTLNTE